MAEVAVLSGVLRELLSLLGSSLKDELGLFWGVKKEKQKLESNLSRITATLQDAERRQVNEMVVRDWLQKLKDAAYDAEDVVDEFVVESRRRKVENGDGRRTKVSNFFSPMNPLAFRLKMARKMQELRKQFDGLAKENNDFQLREGVVYSQPSITTRREFHSHLTEEDIYGRHIEKSKLLDLLLNSGNEEDLSVISIVGMGGVGKTTLARIVYNDASVVTYFELRMWVCVSMDFDKGRLLKEILNSATGCDNNLGIRESQEYFQKIMSRKRYLLVLDDVWNDNPNEWNKLKTWLKCGAKGSKILVTTRSDKVARIMQALPGLHLKTLSEKDSWELFQQLARPDPTNVSIGKELVKKCAGLPVAIKILGRLMSSENRWEYVRNNEFWKHDDGILPILKLSYDDLSPYLKQCFTYCAVIPKRTKTNRDKLIKQWIAQGFIHSDEENELLEENGEVCFNEILQRSLFQVDGETNDINVEQFTIHDLILDLLKSIVGDEYFVVEASMNIVPKRTRHLALWDHEWARDPRNLEVLKKCTKLRSMFLPRHFVDINVCLSLTCLRVLDLSYTEIDNLPNSIDKLKHLRYLDISYTKIGELYETLCNLHSLQTLILLGTPLKKLPKNMKKMICIRHIEFDADNEFFLPKGIGELTSLRTLPKFVVNENSGCGIDELERLNQLLGDIRIEGLDNIRKSVCARKANLKEKQHLRSLVLSWSDADADAAVNRDGNAEEVIQNLEPHSNLKKLAVKKYRGMIFPSWMMMLTNLVELKLSQCNRCEYLPPLGKLYFLRSLNIEEMGAIKYIVESQGSCNYDPVFPSLQYLVLSNMTNLERWSSQEEDGNGDGQKRGRDEQVIPHCLRHLVIYNCPNLTQLPQLHLRTPLEYVKIQNVGCNRINIPMSESLKEVMLENIPNLKRWSPQEADDDDNDQVICRSLRTLRIFDCPMLISMPRLLLPALECLMMRNVGCHKMDLSTSQSLREVSLINMPNLERWSSQEVGNDEQVVFPSHMKLEVEKCPKWSACPIFLSLEALSTSATNEMLTTLH